MEGWLISTIIKAWRFPRMIKRVSNMNKIYNNNANRKLYFEGFLEIKNKKKIKIS